MKEARVFLGNGLIAPAAAVYFHVFLSRRLSSFFVRSPKSFFVRSPKKLDFFKTKMYDKLY